MPDAPESSSRTDRIDLTTTSVGRDTLVRTYTSFFRNVSFTGSFHVFLTVDPAYGVDEGEIAATCEFVRTLPERYPQVAASRVERFARPVGLSGALSVLLASATAPIGVHLEDDWEFRAPLDLDGLVADLYEQDSTQIVFGNSHTARGGTFDSPEEATPVRGARCELLRLQPASWAAYFMPLAPHVHRRSRWSATVARALAGTDPARCPDERVRDQIVAEGSYERHNVLWTRDIVAHDIGREWMRARRLHRAISPEQRTAHAVPAVRPQPGGPLRLARSQQLADRAMAVTPGMTHTYHKRPENFAPGAYPTYLERGDGAVVWDVDGQAYVDFVCALGAATLGHNHPAVSNTLRERAGRGVLLSLPTPAEVSAAESFTAQVPGVDMVRFLKTGAEACSAAIRLARSLTGRDAVLLVGYHGWHDQLMGSAPGIPPSVAALTRRTHLDSPDAEEQFCADLDRRGDQLAAVMVSTPYHRQLDAALLQRVRQLCDRTGTLLILDEVVTGFRLAPGGLGQLRGVAADLLCFSKGLAAGMPLAAVAGPRHIMSAFATQRVSSTFAGEALSLEVMKATLQEYTTDDYYGRIARLGRRLRTGLNAAARRRGMPNFVFGYDPMPCLRFSADPTEHARTAEAFLAGMARRGVLMRRDVNFVCAAHQEEQIDFALAAADGVLSEIAVGTPAPVAPAVLR